MNQLPHSLAGTLNTISTRGSKLVLFAAGSGAPILLIHSVNAVASAAEVRPLYDHLVTHGRAVYALDLPGYGLSARDDRPYTVKVMTDAIVQAAQWIQARHNGALMDAVAVSLASEFLARTAVENQSLFASLTLVSPTGLRGGQVLQEADGSNRYKASLDHFLRWPGWGGFWFRQLTRPRVIRYFLERTWGSKAIDETLWTYNCMTARQPGAEFAPLAFLSGILFSTDIHRVYQQVSQPTLVVYGTRGDFTDYGMLSIVADRSNWRVHVLQTGALPYFEAPKDYFEVQDEFLQMGSDTGRQGGHSDAAAQSVDSY